MGGVDERMTDPAGDRVVAGVLVAAQLALMAVLLLPGRARRRRRAARSGGVLGALLVAGGGGLALSGALALGPALTPSSLPAALGQLRTGGPYRSLRHPIYTGLTAAAAGRALGTGDRRHALAALALGALFVGKGRFEERRLVARYPDYAEYARRTPAVARARGRSTDGARPGGGPGPAATAPGPAAGAPGGAEGSG